MGDDDDDSVIHYYIDYESKADGGKDQTGCHVTLLCKLVCLNFFCESVKHDHALKCIPLGYVQINENLTHHMKSWLGHDYNGVMWCM